MATHDYVIANGTGAAVRSDLNNALAAIVSNNSGSSEPSTTYAYQWWADTNANLLKIRNSANNGWITLRELDGTLLMEDGTEAAPSLSFATDLNTGLFRSAENKLNISAGGAERLEIGSSEVVFNDPSNDVDFRVESNGQTHMLFVDAGNDRIGVGTDSPTSIFDVEVATNAGINFTNVSSAPILDFKAGSVESAGRIRVNEASGGGVLQFATKDTGGTITEAFRVDTSGRMLIGTSSIRDKYFSGTYSGRLSVEGTSDATRLVQHVHNENSASQPFFILGKSRGSAVSSYTVVQDNDFLGTISFQGADGARMVDGARIEVEVNGTPGTNDMPTDMVFKTNDGATAPTERFRIDKNGNVGIGESTPDRLLHLKAASSTAYSGGSDTAGYNFLKLENTTDDKSVGMFFQIGSNGEAAITATEATDGSTDIAFQNRGGGVRSEKMRLNGSGQLLVGTTSSSVSADKVLVSGQLNAGGVRFASLAKSDTVGSTMTFDISGSNEGYVFVRIRIKVGYSGNANYQMHAQYDYATCNYGTSGSTASQTAIHQVEAGNAQFNYSDITVTRPADRTVRVQYSPSSGSGTHSCKVMVDGAFDSIS